MKKTLLLSFLLIAATITGCEIHCIWYYNVFNKSSSTINVKISEGNKNTTITNYTITPDTELPVNKDSSDCGGKWPGDRFPNDEFTVMMRGAITIDGNKISDNIWKRKYWTFRSQEHGGTYTLVITDELIEDLIETTNVN